MMPQKKKIALFSLLMIVVAFAAGYMYLSKEKMNLGTLFSAGVDIEGLENGKAFKFPDDFSESLTFEVCDSGILVCDKNGVCAYNRRGEQLWKYGGIYSSPIMKAAGQIVMLADVGGKNITVLENGRVKLEHSVPGPVINAGMNENGYVWVVHEQTGYRNAVTVISPYGWLFTRNWAEDFTVSADISPDNSDVLINNIDASKIRTGTNFVFLNLKGEVFSTITYEDAVFSSVGYMENGNIIAAGNSTVMCLDRNRKEKWRCNMEKNQLYAVSFEEGKILAIAMSGENKAGFFEGAESVVKILDDGGRTTGQCTIPGQIKSVDCNGEIVSANTGREVYFITNRGRIRGKYTSDREIKSVKLINNSEAAVFTTNSIIITEIK